MNTPTQVAPPHEWADLALASQQDEHQLLWLKRLALNVKYFRRMQNISQEALADKCGIYRTYLSRIETGKCNPSLSVLVSLAHALNVKPDALLANLD